MQPRIASMLKLLLHQLDFPLLCSANIAHTNYELAIVAVSEYRHGTALYMATPLCAWVLQQQSSFLTTLQRQTRINTKVEVLV